MTAVDALNLFLADRELRCVRRIVNWYKSHVGLFLRWLEEQGIVQIADVRTEHVEQYIASLRARDRMNRAGKLSPVLIQKRLSAIRTFCKWLTEQSIIPANPALKLRVHKFGRRLPKALPPEQVRKLRDAPMSQRDRAIIYLMLDSGLRLNEVANLKIDDLDFERGIVHVRSGKGDKERYALFASRAADEIRAWLVVRGNLPWEGSLFVGAQSKPLTGSGIYQAIKDIAKLAGVNLSPHMLRHTFATEYLNAGGSIQDLQQLLGHEDINTTMVYVHVAMGRLIAKHEQFSLVNQMKQSNPLTIPAIANTRDHERPQHAKLPIPTQP